MENLELKLDNIKTTKQLGLNQSLVDQYFKQYIKEKNNYYLNEVYKQND